MNDTPRSMDDSLARVKLHARLNEAAEKALALLRDPAARAGDAISTLREEILGEREPGTAAPWVRKADRWASAADRPRFPCADWTEVNFAQQPVIKHPLSAENLDLKRIDHFETDLADLEAHALQHFRSLVHRGGDGSCDLRQTLLAFWRFGPEQRPGGDGTGLAELWRRLPADTRVPGHTTWDHLDLVSAFAGAFHGDQQGQCALLNVSIGPVQDFIAAARTTSDLWAGSHLLARLSWEAMRVVCERLGPDAVIFPSLRGVPQVDLWLVNAGMDRDLFSQEDWSRHVATDSNPLFSAALPNRFLAIVPASQAKALAGEIEHRVRAWLKDTAADALQRLLEVAELDDSPGLYAYRQLEEQLDGFPEIQWSIVEYDALIGADGPGEETALDTTMIATALAAFHGVHGDRPPGYLGSDGWDVLQRTVELAATDGAEVEIFYQPNPGVLYPAMHDLAERSLATAKAVRPFSGLAQNGFRCSLTGEVEWLTHDASHLALPPGERAAAGTLWARVARKRPAWARKGEHLGALSALKRVWPTIFCDELAGVLQLEDVPKRFVVSTHAMALASSIATAEVDVSALDESTRRRILDSERAAFPRRLAKMLRRHEHGELLARLPTWLDTRDEEDAPGDDPAVAVLERLLGRKPEGYYALLLMDGDHMGRWLAGDPEFSTPFIESFHPAVRAKLEQRAAGHAGLQSYLDAPRTVSLGRHMAISSALNDFSGVIARWIVEERHSGRVLYAGGDDLMAMLPTNDLLGVMRELRQAYSGMLPPNSQSEDGWCGAGFVHRHGRIHVCMGARATASAGAVVVHHKTPLVHALAELRRAEQRAKTEGGRDAYSLSVLKRAGGALRHTGRWQVGRGDVDEMGCLHELSVALRDKPGASRRAVYNADSWLVDLPEPAALGGAQGVQAYLAAVLAYQFARQGLEERDTPVHSKRLAQLAPWSPIDGRELESAATIRARVMNLLGVAEFLAREARG